MKTILVFGDVVGRPGRSALKVFLKSMIEEHAADLVIANGENAAGGLGIDAKCANEIKSAGVQLITLGDHTWQRREVRPFLDESSDWCIRPANYPEGAPGKGYAVLERAGVRFGLMNLMGRTFFNFSLDCPFRAADALLQRELSDCQIIICDMHAEATSEKVAMPQYLDGRVSLVFGTHTHVQTADERILPGGTACITDVGMCGPADGVIGMDADTALSRLLSGVPESYKVARGNVILNGLVVKVDETTGKAESIERIYRIEDLS